MKRLGSYGHGFVLFPQVKPDFIDGAHAAFARNSLDLEPVCDEGSGLHGGNSIASMSRRTRTRSRGRALDPRGADRTRSSRG
jgi:hypothetical protein